MIERRKANAYYSRSANSYFWRTYDQKEIDLIEEREGQLFGYEFKWQGQIRKATQRDFTITYPQSELTTIRPDNFVEFLA